MKKTILTSFLTLLIINLQAQEQAEESYKPQAGDKNLEVQFSPSSSTVISINGIRGRKFKSEVSAFRFNVFVGINNDTQVTRQESGTLKELKDKNTIYTVNFRPGFEKHLPGTKRLSPYFGYEFDLALQKSISKSESQAGTDIETDSEHDLFGYWRLGLNGIAGFDYYIAKNLYMGSEIGFGFAYKKDMSVKHKSTRAGFTEPDPTKRGGSFNLGPNVNAFVRVGYIF